jgi:DNA-directed RNA polymerase subunit beta
MLTIKSEDTVGRVKAYEAIVKGENIAEPSIPESFKVLLKEMQSLALDVNVVSEEGERAEMREEDDDLLRAAEELGIDLSGVRSNDSPAADEAIDDEAEEGEGAEAPDEDGDDEPDIDATGSADSSDGDQPALAIEPDEVEDDVVLPSDEIELEESET